MRWYLQLCKATTLTVEVGDFRFDGRILRLQPQRCSKILAIEARQMHLLPPCKRAVKHPASPARFTRGSIRLHAMEALQLKGTGLVQALATGETSRI